MHRTVLDRLIGYVSPAAELRRLQARNRIEMAAKANSATKRLYEGAQPGRRTDGWIRTASDANAEIVRAAPALRKSARDLVRNNAYAALALQEWEGNAAPLAARAQVDETDAATARKLNEAVDALWYEQCQAIDPNGDTFDAQQCLAVRSIVESGAVLVRRIEGSANERAPLPFHLQILEPDHLDGSQDRELPDGGAIIGGVEIDAAGQVQRYHILREHPGAAAVFTRRLGSAPVPASEMLHVFERLRPEQLHGASWFAPVIVKARDLDQYDEAELVRKQIESCMAAFVEDVDSSLGDYTLGASVFDSNGDRIEEFRPGMIGYLPSGRRVTMAVPSSSGGYSEYMRTQLRGYAAGLALTYELLTGDMSQVNFSSGRMGLAGFKRRVRKLHNKVLIPRLLDPVWRWFITYAQAAGKVDERKIWAKWTPPRWDSIQPVDDATADLINMRSGAATFGQVVSERGYDPVDQLREIAEYNSILDNLGIVLDSDPRQRTKTGAAVATDGGGSADSGLNDTNDPAGAARKRLRVAIDNGLPGSSADAV